MKTDKRVTPDDLPDLPSRDVASLSCCALPATPAALRRGFVKLGNELQDKSFPTFPDSGQPWNYPNGFER